MTVTKTFLLLTALPPTKGHRELIRYAAELADYVTVIVCTQPDEPFVSERNWAVQQMCNEVADRSNALIQLHLINETLPQEPEDDPGFWDMWAKFLVRAGFQWGDTIVASERYGKTLAEHVGGRFMPFDIGRQLNPQKATLVRQEPRRNFDWIDQTFQHHLRKHITVFGAESTGKTTLSKALSEACDGHWLFEYARPYLENTSIDLSDSAMTNIWHGQRALQDYGFGLYDKPFVFQDTDLFSTIGYWDYSEWGQYDVTRGAPGKLIQDAELLKSDLYIITQSNIPFEHDAIRYGGDHREILDNVWIELCETYKLPYMVLHSSDLDARVREARPHIEAVFDIDADKLSTYTRRGSEYR